MYMILSQMSAYHNVLKNQSDFMLQTTLLQVSSTEKKMAANTKERLASENLGKILTVLRAYRLKEVHKNLS